MSYLSAALPLAQHSSTNLGFLAWDPKQYSALGYDARPMNSPSPTVTSSKPSSEFIRPSYESRWSDSSANHSNHNTRSTRRTASTTEYEDEDEDEDDDTEFYHPRRSPKPTYHSTYSARSSLSLGITQAFYLSTTTVGPPPPLPPFPSEFYPEGLPRKYSPSPSPVVGEFDPNADERYFVTRSKSSVAAGLKKQLKRMFRRRSGSVARAL